MATCMIPNCRKLAPSDEAFCAEHREPDLREKVAILARALRFYADPVVYSMPVQNMNRHVFPDRGERARKALNKCGLSAAQEQKQP